MKIVATISDGEGFVEQVLAESSQSDDTIVSHFVSSNAKRLAEKNLKLWRLKVVKHTPVESL